MDVATLKALAELYEREGDDRRLASALRRQIELEAADSDKHGALRSTSADVRDAQKRGQAAAARGERIAMLRRLGVLCDTRLSDLEGVVWASRSILELLPGDREALERLERRYSPRRTT